MSWYMDWERKFSKTEFVLKECYTVADILLASVGGLYSYILSLSPQVRITVVARSNYAIVKEYVSSPHTSYAATMHSLQLFTTWSIAHAYLCRVSNSKVKSMVLGL